MQPFIILQQKNLRIAQVKCCPTMDVISFLTMDNQLLVYVSMKKYLFVVIKVEDVCVENSIMAKSITY